MSREEKSASTAKDQIWTIESNIAMVSTLDSHRVVAMNLDDFYPILIEGSAFAIWQMIDGISPESKIILELSKLFELKPLQIESAVRSVLLDLEKQSLITAQA